MKKVFNSFKRLKQLTSITTSLLILVLLSISPVAASVSNWDFSPPNPVSGDIMNLKGSASPGDKVDIYVNFEKTVPVSGGKYEYVLENVNIPEGLSNLFKVEATGAKDLNVRVKMLLWLTKSSDASGNTATVSQSNVPPGTYMIRIDGNAGEGVSEVNLKITAFQEIKADSNGDFSYSYNTQSVPPGNFEIKVGDIAKEITIQSEGTSDSSSGSSSNSGSYSNSGSGSNSGSNPTESSSGKTDTTNTQSPTTSGSSSSTMGSTPANTGSSLQPGAPKDTGETASGASNLNKDSGEKDTQTQPSAEGKKTSSSSNSSVDVFYLLVGVGAGLLILIMYTLKRQS